MSVQESVEKQSPSAGAGRRSTWIAAVLLAVSEFVGAAPDAVVPYPEGYREWTHVSSAFVGPQSAGFERNGGLHHIYANKEALVGYRTGRFPDGSLIVADFLEPREKDGWRFEQFKGDSRTDRLVTPEVAARCVACHSQRKEQDFVFSTLRK